MHTLVLRNRRSNTRAFGAEGQASGNGKRYLRKRMAKLGWVLGIGSWVAEFREGFWAQGCSKRERMKHHRWERCSTGFNS